MISCRVPECIFQAKKDHLGLCQFHWIVYKGKKVGRLEMSSKGRWRLWQDTSA